MSIEEYFGDWYPFISPSITNNILRQISKDRFYPESCNVFKAFRYCPMKKCKIIFLGQDPFPQKGVATGIMFANDEKREHLSPSLEVLKEAAIDYSIPHYGIEFDQTLASWEEQGVLMLNSALTVKPNQPGSHDLIWRPFTKYFLKNFTQWYSNVAVVLFGKKAESFEDCISDTCKIFKREHPAYLARQHRKLDHQLFIDLNRYCRDVFKETIRWYTDTNEYLE